MLDGGYPDYCFPFTYVDYLIHTMCPNLIQPLKPKRAFGPTLKSPLVLHAAICRYWHRWLDASSLQTASHAVGPTLQIPQIPTQPHPTKGSRLRRR